MGVMFIEKKFNSLKKLLDVLLGPALSDVPLRYAFWGGGGFTVILPVFLLGIVL